MITALKGGTLWAVVAIVLAIVGASTYLASQGILSGSDWLVLGTAVLASVGIVTGAHVASQAAVNALNMPPPGSPVPPPSPVPPGGGVGIANTSQPASQPAMP